MPEAIKLYVVLLMADVISSDVLVKIVLMHKQSNTTLESVYF